MSAAPARRRGRCAKVATYPTAGLSVLGGAGDLDVPAALSALGGGGDLGMRKPFGPEEACLARGGRKGQAALTAFARSMLDRAARSGAVKQGGARAFFPGRA
jgi:hypothetical protein